jgi:hypothetical protein
MLGLGLTLLAAPVVAVESDDVDPVDEEQIESQAMDELLLNREQYFYSSFGRRDPFGSLLKGQFSKTEDGDVLDIGELSMVGVVWGEEDKFAVVEDKRGHSHVLREGDRVVNGRVLRITQTSLTVQHYFFGETSNVTIYMNEGEGSYVAP